jgi:hypothetical protein
MVFVCYSFAVAILGFAYEEPDLFLMIAMLLAAKHLLWRSR